MLRSVLLFIIMQNQESVPVAIEEKKKEAKKVGRVTAKAHHLTDSKQGFISLYKATKRIQEGGKSLDGF